MRCLPYWRLFSYLKALWVFFRSHPEYRILHGHMTNTACFYLSIAKRCDVSCRIIHSHSTRRKQGLMGLVTDFLQKPIYRLATDWYACSEAAKNWFYPPAFLAREEVRIIPNAIDLEEFRFHPEVRAAIRKQLSLGDALTVTCIARFRPEKNQCFLIDVLQEMLKTYSNTIFLFIGDGPCEQAVRSRAMQYGLSSHVRFLGQRSDVAELLQAADAFVIPSLWEGLPVAGIEALANGLHGVASDGVSKELNLLDMVEYVSLQAPLEDWSRALLRAAAQPRRDTVGALRSAGYDSCTTALWLQAFYLRKHDEAAKKESCQ